MKEVSHKGHIVRFHLYQVLQKSKFIESDKCLPKTTEDKERMGSSFLLGDMNRAWICRPWCPWNWRKTPSRAEWSPGAERQ